MYTHKWIPELLSTVIFLSFSSANPEPHEVCVQAMKHVEIIGQLEVLLFCPHVGSRNRSYVIGFV